jgi:hypothetical protein
MTKRVGNHPGPTLPQGIAAYKGEVPLNPLGSHGTVDRVTAAGRTPP